MTMTELYHSFLKTFDNRLDGFDLKETAKWYYRAYNDKHGKSPFEGSYDGIFNNWENTNNSYRSQAVKITTDIRGKLVELGKRAAYTEMQQTFEKCIGHDGEERNVYECEVVATLAEVLEKRDRRNILAKGTRWYVEPLSDVALVETKRGVKTPLDKVIGYAKGQERAQRKENRQVLDVAGEGPSKIEPGLMPMAAMVQESKSNIIGVARHTLEGVDEEFGALHKEMARKFYEANENYKRTRIENDELKRRLSMYEGPYEQQG